MKRRTAVKNIAGFTATCLFPALVLPRNVLAWGSFRPLENSPLFSSNTHQLIMQNAMIMLRGDPIFKKTPFPAVHNIIKHDWVTYDLLKGIVVGPGPDADGNSQYSDHYWNPITRKGNGPMAVREHLIELLKGMYYNPNGPITAKGASWAGHFTADMHVPYHVVGIPASEAYNNARNNSGYLSEEQCGPLSLSSHHPSGWGRNNDFTYALNYFVNHNPPGKDPNIGIHPTVDWYDPWYSNGYAVRDISNDLFLNYEDSSLLYSSHVSWEERAHSRWDVNEANRIYAEMTKLSPYDIENWVNNKVGASDNYYTVIADSAAWYAHLCALGTRNLIEGGRPEPTFLICRAIRAVATLFRACMTGIDLEYRIGRSTDNDVEVIATAYNHHPTHNLYDVDMTLNYGPHEYTRKIFLQSKGAVTPNQSVTMTFRVPVPINRMVKVSLDATGLYHKTPDACYQFTTFELANTNRNDQETHDDSNRNDQEIHDDSTDNNKNPALKTCPGHIMWCKERPNIRWGAYKKNGISLDRNEDRICDVCGLPVNSDVRSGDCRESKWDPNED